MTIYTVIIKIPKPKRKRYKFTIQAETSESAINQAIAHLPPDEREIENTEYITSIARLDDPRIGQLYLFD